MRILGITLLLAILLPSPTWADEPEGGPAFFTKQMSGNEVKIYAKDIVGVGKVSFQMNGDEIVWVRAVDSSDKKLRILDGIPYLVRTVNLRPGQNRIQILVDGKRAWSATYSR